jgi:cytochrome c oxidase assembly factor CtaG
MSDRRQPRPPPSGRTRLADLLERKQLALEALARRHWRTVGVIFAGCCVYALLGAAAEHLPGIALVAVLILAGLPLGLLAVQLYALAFERLQEFAPVERLKRLGRRQLVLLLAGSWLAIVGWFSALSLYLDRNTGIGFRTRAGEAVEHSGQLADFFVWQFLNQAPILDATDTLHWEVPLTYGGGAGFVVLAFKAFVIVPLLAALAAALASGAVKGAPSSADR